ncbi:hypothetical protein CG736_31395 [Kitasatospora sp. CB02891]|nr:hypothetical protein CG736_31395 [Kitasatospora sp. CB02891]
MPYAALAARTGPPAATVRRRLAELRESGRAVLRDSPRATGYPATRWARRSGWTSPGRAAGRRPPTRPGCRRPGCARSPSAPPT